MSRPMKMEDASGFPSTASSNQSGSNDFVKKLFQMLQEDLYKDVVRWTTNGDSFVVLNTNEFTKEILPRHFKHSNFASFVRQLNKYDFHKVKIPNEEKQTYQYGEDAWEFKHPDFRYNDRESLENIKRKGPSSKKTSGLLHSLLASNYMVPENFALQAQAQFQLLKDEITSLRTENKTLHQDISILNTKYKALIDNIVAIKSLDERYYRSMGMLIHCLVQAGIKLPPLDFPNPNHVSMTGLSTHQLPPQPAPHQASPTADTITPKPMSPQHLVSTTSPIPLQTTSTSASQQQSPQSTAPTNASTSGELPQVSTTNLTNPKFHVLLVEDDNVCIQLCRKFLVKYGCQVTVVTDGLNAISTVENTKYDLVLMDIVMPNLDGATATSVIRSFDTRTPIIAMTGNIEDNDLVTYLQNGMSDILAKPFTKDDLYSILSKHLLAIGDTTASPNTSAADAELVADDANGEPLAKKKRVA